MKPRYLRLLPGVVAVGAALLVLNATGLVHDAYAAGAPAPIAADPAPMNADYAEAGDAAASAAQVDVMGSFAKRRVELDARESQLNTQANILAAAESRVDAKIGQLKTLQDGIAKLLAQRDTAQQAQINALVKTYVGMGKKAGPIFAGLPDDVAVPVAQAMKPDDLAVILGGMPTDAAQKLTVKLASRLALPVDAAAALPAATAPVAPLASAAAAAPAQAAANAAPAAATAAAKTPTPPKS